MDKAENAPNALTRCWRSRDREGKSEWIYEAFQRSTVYLLYVHLSSWIAIELVIPECGQIPNLFEFVRVIDNHSGIAIVLVALDSEKTWSLVQAFQERCCKFSNTEKSCTSKWADSGLGWDRNCLHVQEQKESYLNVKTEQTSIPFQSLWNNVSFNLGTCWLHSNQFQA